jgi:UDP-glucose 4-epimerase
MHVLLTGATGNVGSHVLPELTRRGHRVRAFAGDVTEPTEVAEAVAGVDAVIHLAAVIPPESDEWPAWAHEVNVRGTRNVVEACQTQAEPPRLLFTSTFDVHGRTQGKVPPRRVDDPLVAVDPYTEHKIECERLIHESDLDWLILRLTDVPVLAIRKAHPIMFEIGLDNRIEVIHADDVAVAIANALTIAEVWGRVLFVGGGPSCQGDLPGLPDPPAGRYGNQTVAGQGFQ